MNRMPIPRTSPGFATYMRAAAAAPRPLRGLPAPPRHPDRRAGRVRPGRCAGGDARGDRRRRGAARARSRARLRHRLCRPAAAASGRAGRASASSSRRTAHEDARRGGQRWAPHRDGARCVGVGYGRGRRHAGGRLPRDGLRDRFGRDRCVDTPLAEAGILGAAVGLAMAGFRPVCEMQYDAFSYPCLDQLICHVGRYRWRTEERWISDHRADAVRRRVRAPELHDDSPEAYYVHTRESRSRSRPLRPTRRAFWPRRSATPTRS